MGGAHLVISAESKLVGYHFSARRRQLRYTEYGPGYIHSQVLTGTTNIQVLIEIRMSRKLLIILLTFVRWIESCLQTVCCDWPYINTNMCT